MASARRRTAFTLVELLVVIGIIAVLIGLLLPALARVRESGYVTSCASNLRQIGQAMQMYAQDNFGFYPRTRYSSGSTPKAGTGITAVDPFQTGGPGSNDVTAALFLLIRTQKISTKIFTCPFTDLSIHTPDNQADVMSRSNFTDYRRNLGYSIANPYGNSSATSNGYLWGQGMQTGLALAGDLNCGTLGSLGDNVTFPNVTSATRDMRRANSANHQKKNQNVLYADGHVVLQATPFCGINGDNIYTNKSGQVVASPADKDDSVLLPTDD